MSIAHNSETLEIFALKPETCLNSQNHHHYSASLEILANMLSKKKKKKAKQKIKFVIVYGMIILKPQRKIIRI